MLIQKNLVLGVGSRYLRPFVVQRVYFGLHALLWMSVIGFSFDHGFVSRGIFSLVGAISATLWAATNIVCILRTRGCLQPLEGRVWRLVAFLTSLAVALAATQVRAALSIWSEAETIHLQGHSPFDGGFALIVARPIMAAVLAVVLDTGNEADVPDDTQSLKSCTPNIDNLRFKYKMKKTNHRVACLTCSACICIGSLSIAVLDDVQAKTLTEAFFWVGASGITIFYIIASESNRDEEMGAVVVHGKMRRDRKKIKVRFKWVVEYGLVLVDTITLCSESLGVSQFLWPPALTNLGSWTLLAPIIGLKTHENIRIGVCLSMMLVYFTLLVCSEPIMNR